MPEEQKKSSANAVPGGKCVVCDGEKHGTDVGGRCRVGMVLTERGRLMLSGPSNEGMRQWAMFDRYVSERWRIEEIPEGGVGRSNLVVDDVSDTVQCEALEAVGVKEYSSGTANE